MGEADTELSSESEDVLATSRWSIGNWAVIGVFFVFTVVGVAMAAGLFGRGVLTETVGGDGSGVTVPLAVFLYATLGALGYVFTKLMTSLDEYDEWADFEKLAEIGLRIPAAWLLAAGVYQFGSLAIGSSSLGATQLVTGVPFLVGLYVNVAYKWLGGLADRLLGREPERAEWATSQPGQGEADNRRPDSGDSVGGHD
ncbi:unknown [Haloarcula marismortui ATCC 43049]|uniref:Uncharacterized protein n=1 Tax=Haloarcula marismortui (strain ATCC 43049 / DSM 3752 / JCM 8966 / VKM B-1809) TaxID=272569 RepID=Q5UYC9_HALMA|nr:hypothetical protein [Haloarcula marismortui]AAV47724.1 unknown [Haloarcula marismortui ATCC 43049]QCP92409.1 hypothetical protein E6P14_16685 [Haloarcula marismortui ATCC 43049]